MLDFNRLEVAQLRLLRDAGRLGDRHFYMQSPRSSRSHGIRKSGAEILALFADLEPKVQGSPAYLTYRRVLRDVMALIGAELGFRCTEAELGCLADTLARLADFPGSCGCVE